MRKYLLVAAMGLAACGSNKKTSTTVSNGNGNSTTITGDTGSAGGTGNANQTPVDPSTLTGPDVVQMGRFTAVTGGNEMAWAGSRITAGVTGTNTLSVGLQTSSMYNQGTVSFSVTIDGSPAPTPVIHLDNTQAIKSFTVQLPDTKQHYVQVTKISEPAYGLAVFTGVTPGAGGTLSGTPAVSQRHIEFIGDSIVNGYGVEGTDPCNGNSTNSNADQSFATLTAKALGADYTLIAYSGRGLATNLDGTNTSTQTANDPANANNIMPAMFLNTIPPSSATPTPIAWDPTLIQPQVVVINLGTNDFSYAIKAYTATGQATTSCTATLCNPDQTAFTGAYTTFLGKVRAAYPNAHIIATTGPMLSDSYPTAAQQHATSKTWISNAVTATNDANITFYDFGVQATTSTACNSHPNASEHQAMATGGTDALNNVQVGLVSYIKSLTNWQ